ncbi:MAG: SpoIID/LytB domain-containing protein [Oscillospiraceae bacterium]|nr:SpoIID/LytB domain-containing protein [Oscillospiraceae bacterium]
MNLKGTLGGIAVMLAVGVFYTFAFCIVEDVDANSISEEYYYYPQETDAVDVLQAENTEPQETQGMHNTDSQTPESADKTQENAAPKHDLEITDIASAAVSERDYAGANSAKENKDSSDGSDKAAAETVHTKKQTETEPAPSHSETEGNHAAGYDNGGEYEDPDEDLDEISDISDAAETEVPETETELTSETETEFKPFADDDEDFLALLTSGTVTEETTSETAVSVDVSVGADISTSETFTAKFNGSTQTVNAYDLICQIVNNEMSPSFSDEAIKAQAVAAYSYVKYHNVNGLTPSVLVKKNPSDRIKNLVSEVWGVCCYYNGSVAQTVYMASSSGYTADAEHVWGGSVPYLKSVYCPFDVGNDPNYGSTLEVSESSMRSMLENSLGISLSNNPYNWLKIQNYIDGNYVYEISVDGQKTISGKKLRETVMGHKLKSAAFDVSYKDGVFIFTTYGYGHGVGMSQNGANILAKQGYTYYDILKFYFTGIEII